jgi:hypothetical protein
MTFPILEFVQLMRRGNHTPRPSALFDVSIITILIYNQLTKLAQSCRLRNIAGRFINIEAGSFMSCIFVTGDRDQSTELCT